MDLTSGHTIADLPDPRGNDHGPALSPDGSRLVVATPRGFEIRSPQGVVGMMAGMRPAQPGSLLQMSIAPFAVGWAAHGRLLVSVNQGATCSVWSAEGNLLRTWATDSIPELAVHPLEPLAAFTSDDGRVEVRDLESGALLTEFFDTIGRRAHRELTSARTASACFLPAAPRLLCAWESRQVKCWRWRETQPAARLRHGHEFAVASLSWNDTSSQLATCGGDGRVLLWDAREAKLQTEIRLSREAGVGAAGAVFGPDGTVFTVDSLGHSAAWHPDGQPAPLLPLPPPVPTANLADLRSLLVNPAGMDGLPPLLAGGVLLTASRGEREVHLRDLQARLVRPGLATSGGRVQAMALAADLLLLAEDDGTVAGLPLTAGRSAFTAKPSGKPLRRLRAETAGRFAVIDSAGAAAAFSLPGGQELDRLSLEKTKINDLCFSRDGGTLFLACDDNTVLSRPLDRGRPPSTLTDSAQPPARVMPVPALFGETPKGVLGLARSHDGRWLAGSIAYGALCLWEIPTGRLLYRLPLDRPEALAFSPDDHWLAAGTSAGKVCLLQLAPP